MEEKLLDNNQQEVVWSRSTSWIADFAGFIVVLFGLGLIWISLFEPIVKGFFAVVIFF
ncbi:MAG: hypothetical protein U9R39_03200 [Campylobacterota bacterium]|nr:hypothetical protein [Campylobacterota bacterium]